VLELLAKPFWRERALEGFSIEVAFVPGSKPADFLFFKYCSV
jgi:hypothetical protein